MEEEPLEDGEILLIIDASEWYSWYTECFSAEQVARLPEHNSCNHQISLQDPNAKLPIGAIFKTTWEEDDTLWKYLQEDIPAGKVWHTRSAADAPILFVYKKEGSLILCIDYRALNRLTI